MNQAEEEEFIASRWESLHEYVRQMAKPTATRPFSRQTKETK